MYGKHACGFAACLALIHKMSLSEEIHSIFLMESWNENIVLSMGFCSHEKIL